MSTALTLGLIGITLGTAGTIAGSVVSYNQQKAQAAAAEENARMQQQQMEYNQRMAEREAAALEAENLENARRMREAAESARSQRLAMLGKSGAAMSSGSPLAVLGAAAADEELNVMDAHYAGSRQVAAARSKATDYGYGAAIAKQNVLAARNSRPTGAGLFAGTTGAVGSALLSGASLYTNTKTILKN